MTPPHTDPIEDANESEYMELDWDEGQHYKLVMQAPESDPTTRNLELANAAAVLTLNGLGTMDEPVDIRDSEGIVYLLLARSAQHVRFAYTGLTLGYYSGAYSVLRSAIETLSYAALLSASPGEISEWFRNEFSKSRPLTEVESSRSEQLKRAKKALFAMERDREVIREEVTTFYQHANKHVHTTLTGLAHEFGIDLDQFLPEDFEEAFVAAGEDFEKAFDLYVLKSQVGGRRPQQRSPKNTDDMEIVPIGLGCQYNGETLDDLALFAFYIGHRLLDMTADTFSISDTDFVRGYRQWHKEARKTA